MTDLERHDTDILILGSGGAGLFAALHAMQSASDLKITIAVKGLLGKCGCTRMVQGGYNVAVAGGDSVERHFMDTIRGGKWLPHQQIAWRLCETAVVRIRELENEIGCFFDRNPDGSLHQKAFAGQSFDRTVHKGDLTGIEIINRLMEQVLARPVEKLQEHRAIGLIPNKQGDALSGVLFIDMHTGKFRFVRAKAVLMATGGGPTMYRYHTPSGDKSMDGLAMALRQGLPLRDMEMVQFHPTGLLAGDATRMTGTVLEEGLRGAGGYLLNGKGERFMFDYDDNGERATRDVVSRAIFSEMYGAAPTPNGGVYISMAHLGPESVRERFKGMVKRCADCGFDLAAGRVEVVPTAHYFMGGVVVDADTRSELPGLYIAGEDAGGAHGSNRLGGNGVANSTVFGGIAGDVMAADVKTQGQLHAPDEYHIDNEIARALYPTKQKEGDVHGVRSKLMDAMWDDVGVVRSEDGLRRALAKLDDIEQELKNCGVTSGTLAFNLTWHDWLNTNNLIAVSRVIAKSALARQNSRGAHYRSDFTDTGSLHQSYFTQAQYDRTHNSRSKLHLSQQPVDFSIVKPGESLLLDDEVA